MKILDGKKLSEKILNSIKGKLAKQKGKVGLGVILVGKHPASIAYVRQKRLAAERVGMVFREVNLPSTISENKLLREVEKLNRDKKIYGFIIQLPLPSHIDEEKVICAISPFKDVDGFHPHNLGKGFLKMETLLPATPKGILTLLDTYKIPLKGKDICIIGHSNIVGKPLAMLLFNRDATVTVAHEFTKNLKQYTKQADIVISATGVAKLVKASMLKRGCIVIDCGCAKVGDKLVGDVDFEKVSKIAKMLTPVPGGVGPLTVASLIENTYLAFKSTSICKS